jgi:hypothetical protein
MSNRVPFPTKLNPLWWLGNADDPLLPAGYLADRPRWWRRVCWWCRNPAHNLLHFVLGCKDRWHRRIGPDNSGPHLVIEVWRPFALAGPCFLLGGGWWWTPMLLAPGLYVCW